MKSQSEVKRYYGKLNWDPEFAGITAHEAESGR
jgi:hypothetical protein